MIVAALLGTVLLQERTVTFTHPCAHSSVVLEAFGKAIGETIKISGSVDKDYFLVRFDDMPVEDAKAAISSTLNATWSRRDGVTYLGRTLAQDRSDKLNRDKALRSAIVDEMKAARERIGNAGTLTIQSAVQAMEKVKAANDPWYRYMDKSDPGGRLADRILLTFTVDELMDMQVGSWTYSPTPGPTQFQMPPSWQRAVAVYKEEIVVWQQAMKLEGGNDYILGAGGFDDKLFIDFALEVYRRRDYIDFFYHHTYEY